MTETTRVAVVVELAGGEEWVAGVYDDYAEAVACRKRFSEDMEENGTDLFADVWVRPAE